MKHEVSDKVLQGDCKVTNDEGVSFSALLGSCVSACIWDPSSRIGGMNHIMLPDDQNDHGRAQLHGVSAMETLVNKILREGGDKNNLHVMLLGGAEMHRGNFDVGKRNASLTLSFVESEGYRLVDTCLGGEQGRFVQFWPSLGRVQRRFVGNRGIEHVNVRQQTAVQAKRDTSDVELF